MAPGNDVAAALGSRMTTSSPYCAAAEVGENRTGESSLPARISHRQASAWSLPVGDNVISVLVEDDQALPLAPTSEHADREKSETKRKPHRDNQPRAPRGRRQERAQASIFGRSGKSRTFSYVVQREGARPREGRRAPGSCFYFQSWQRRVERPLRNCLKTISAGTLSLRGRPGCFSFACPCLARSRTGTPLASGFHRYQRRCHSGSTRHRVLRRKATSGSRPLGPHRCEGVQRLIPRSQRSLFNRAGRTCSASADSPSPVAASRSCT